MKKSLIACGLVIGVALITQATCGASANAFDHEYRAYADVLKWHVRVPRVDYAASILSLPGTTRTPMRSWTRSARSDSRPSSAFAR